MILGAHVAPMKDRFWSMCTFSSLIYCDTDFRGTNRMVPMQVGGIGHGSPPWIPRSPNAAIAAVASNGFGSPFIVIIMLLKMIRNGRTTRLLEVVETPLYGVSSANSNQYRYALPN